MLLPLNPKICGYKAKCPSEYTLTQTGFYLLKIFQIFQRSLYEPILGHIQMRIYLHGCPDTGVSYGFGEGGKIKVRIIFVLDVIVGHVGMAKSVHGHIVG